MQSRCRRSETRRPCGPRRSCAMAGADDPDRGTALARRPWPASSRCAGAIATRGGRTGGSDGVICGGRTVSRGADRTGSQRGCLAGPAPVRGGDVLSAARPRTLRSRTSVEELAAPRGRRPDGSRGGALPRDPCRRRVSQRWSCRPASPAGAGRPSHRPCRGPRRRGTRRWWRTPLCRPRTS
jgi:hypothetical protein